MNNAKTLDQILAEIEARAEAATEGPWHNLDIKGKPHKRVLCNTQAEINSPYDSKERAGLKACRGEVANTLSWNSSKVSEQHKEAVTNAAFIAASRTDVPALLKALKLALEMTDAMIEARWIDVYRNKAWNDEAIAKEKAERDELIAEILKGKV